MLSAEIRLCAVTQRARIAFFHLFLSQTAGTGIRAAFGQQKEAFHMIIVGIVGAARWYRAVRFRLIRRWSEAGVRNLCVWEPTHKYFHSPRTAACILIARAARAQNQIGNSWFGAARAQNTAGTNWQWEPIPFIHQHSICRRVEPNKTVPRRKPNFIFCLLSQVRYFTPRPNAINLWTFKQIIFYLPLWAFSIIVENFSRLENRFRGRWPTQRRTLQKIGGALREQLLWDKRQIRSFDARRLIFRRFVVCVARLRAQKQLFAADRETLFLYLETRRVYSFLKTGFACTVHFRRKLAHALSVFRLIAFEVMSH